MKQLLDLCASIIEATTTPDIKPITHSIHVVSDSIEGKVFIDTSYALLTVTSTRKDLYTEITINLKQSTDRQPVEVIEELTSIALKEWSECTSEYLIDNKIKNLLKK
jgi:hypothetical protein